MKNEISGKDERARLRSLYLNGGADRMSESELLELFLFYALSSKDVKTAHYNLMQYFSNDIRRIFTADFDELCKVDGINRNGAVLIHLVNGVLRELRRSENSEVKYLSDIKTTETYVKNELDLLSYERFIVITLSGENEIISCNTVADGTVNFANVEFVKIIKCFLRDNASSIIVAHNHPYGNCVPSGADKTFTRRLSEELNSIGAELKDHLIVGTDAVLSMRNDESYIKCFV